MQKEVNFIIASTENYIELAHFNKCLIDCGGSCNEMSIRDLENRMLEFLSSKDYMAIIFEIENIHIGYVLIEKNREPMFIRHYFIAEKFRRIGYGSAAFRKLIRFLDVDEIDLSVLVSNNIGLQFWTSCGLVPYEIFMHYRTEYLK